MTPLTASEKANQYTLVDLSIILVSYDSLYDLKRCLPTIQKQSVFFSYEIIVVDNHCADGVANWLKLTYPDVLLISNPANTGYAGGNNLGLAHAHGRWSLLINPDVELRSGSLARLFETAQESPDALITPKLLNPCGTINTCGNQMHYTGITTCRGINQPASQFATLHSVPLLSGAAIIGRTALMQELGGFDETYFMYFEDTDLSLRARQRGVALLCEGRAEIVHHYKLNLSASKFYYLERNRLLTFLKIFSRSTLLALMPALLLTELLTWGFGLRNLAYLKSRFQTYQYLWQNRQRIKRERMKLRSQRLSVDDRELLVGSELALPFSSILAKPFDAVLNFLTKAIYQLLIPRHFR